MIDTYIHAHTHTCLTALFPGLPEQDADLNMAYMMPLPLTVSASAKSRLVLQAHLGSTGKRAVKRVFVLHQKQLTAASEPVCSNRDNSTASWESRTSDPVRTMPDSHGDSPLHTDITLNISSFVHHSALLNWPLSVYVEGSSRAKNEIDSSIHFESTPTCDRQTGRHSLSAIDTTADWRRGIVVSGVRRMNEVNARRARLVPGWVTVFGWVYHLRI